MNKGGKLADLPYDDNDEIQHVPPIPHVRVLMHHQTIRDDLQKGLDCENDEEGILNCFLQAHTGKKNRNAHEESRVNKEKHGIRWSVFGNWLQLTSRSLGVAVGWR